MRVFHFYVVGRWAMAISDLKLAPDSRDARIDAQLIAAELETQNVFHGGAIHPSCRTRVPGPTAATRMRRHRVHIADGHVWFDFVFVHAGASRSVINRVQHAEQFTGAVAVP